MLGLSTVQADTAPNVSGADNPIELPPVEVVSDTPLMVSGVPVNKIPAPVHTVTSEQLDRYQSVSLPDYMRWNLGSVTVNDAQNNPFQPDVQFRGFTASPLLGLPQGLAVYVNGIRFNEPFGDTVNWDLIPEGAIERMSLHSGSNPVYGLNSLGGAIAMRTKTGFSAPKHQVEVAGGSWGRHWEEVISGGNNGTLGYFVDLKNFNEDGFRDFSPSDVKQGFGTLSAQNDRSAMNLTLAANDNHLIGNGALPVQLYRQDPEAVFTHPDRTGTRLFLAALDANTWLTDRLELSGNAYFRQNRVNTYNGDDSNFEPCTRPEHAAYLCEASDDGETVVATPGGKPVQAGSSVEGATINTSQTHQRSVGGSIQAAFEQDFSGMNNRLTGGGSYDEASIHFGSDTELASLTADRGTRGSGLLVDESRVRLNAAVQHHGVYLSDSLSVTDQLTLTAAGRYNLSFVQMDDRYGNELNGSHRFDRVNPSGGLTYTFLPELTAYGSYSESNRAPTPMELSCADPEAPCKLPNAFVSDPPLKQVVAKTFEAGLRGDIKPWTDTRLHWTAGVFQTENHDDILFVSSGNLTNQGYFNNVGKTRRRGIELGVSGTVQAVRLNINYTLLDATFRTAFLSSSPNNPYADDQGLLPIAKGNRIPGLPVHGVKVVADYDVLSSLTIGANMVFNSGLYLRGDEANKDKPLAEYALFNLHGEYRFNSKISLFSRIDNLFDQHYNSFGLYGQADDVLGAGYDNARFVGVGAPRAGWVGVKLDL